jgi:hypothetical protein
MPVRRAQLGPPPFEGFLVYGPTLHKGEGRRYVFLVDPNDKHHRTTLSYARYLMSVHLGRRLDRTEEVDHKDNNRLNDTLDNLQILTPLANHQKSAKPRTFVDLTCTFCRKVFKRRKGNEPAPNRVKVSYCNHKCKADAQRSTGR